MRRIVILSLLIIVAISANSQSIKGGFIFGLNMSQVDGDEVAGYKKPGLNAGAVAILPIGDVWSISIETLLSQKGAYEKYPRSWDSVLTVDMLPYYNLRLNYVQVPFMVHYNDKDVITAGLGFAWSRLANGKEIEHGKLIDWESMGDVKRGPYDRDDLSVLIDLRFRLKGRTHFNFRYQYSMMSIREREYSTNTSNWTRKQYNNGLSFRLIYIINDKVLEKSKK